MAATNVCKMRGQSGITSNTLCDMYADKNIKERCLDRVEYNLRMQRFETTIEKQAKELAEKDTTIKQQTQELAKEFVEEKANIRR